MAKAKKPPEEDDKLLFMSALKQARKFLSGLIDIIFRFLKTIVMLFNSATQLVKIGVVVVVILIFTGIIAIPSLKTANVNRRVTSQLFDALDISELNASELIYNGIAEVYDNEGKNLLYRIKYDATVKVGVQMSDIRFEFDNANKAIKPILPEIVIQSPVVDPSSIDDIPQNPNVDLKEALSACKADAQREAEKSDALVKTAADNLKSIIEALLYPIVDDADLHIEW